MHDFPPTSPNRTGGLTVRQASAWALALFLSHFFFVGDAAAEATAPAETAALAAHAALAQRLPKELHLELAPSCLGADKTYRTCSLEGDFDGDEKPDLAILVQEKGCASRGPGLCARLGIVFLLGSGKREVLGAGKGRWQKVDEQTGKAGKSTALATTDFAVDSTDHWAWRVWHITPAGPRPLSGNSPHPDKNPPGMRRDAIEIFGGDASFLLYRTAEGWIKYALGY